MFGWRYCCRPPWLLSGAGIMDAAGDASAGELRESINDEQAEDAEEVEEAEYGGEVGGGAPSYDGLLPMAEGRAGALLGCWEITPPFAGEAGRCERGSSTLDRWLSAPPPRPPW